jgi:type II secretory pathway component PulF
MAVQLQDDKVLFFAKMGVMLSNGIPVITTLQNLEKEAYTDVLKDVARTVRLRLEAEPIEKRAKLPREGALARLLGEQSHQFEEEILELVRTGEETGCLDLMARIIPEYILFGNLENWKGSDVSV